MSFPLIVIACTIPPFMPNPNDSQVSVAPLHLAMFLIIDPPAVINLPPIIC